MPKSFKPLPTIHLTAGTDFLHPPEPPEVIHLDDPALSVMVDLAHMNAFTILPTAKISDAVTEMRVCKTHLLLVVDEHNKIIGLIGSEDILGERPLKVSQERFVKRSEILVRMVMTPQENIIALNTEDMRFAKVGDVVVTLHQHQQHYALAVEIDNSGHQTVVGLFSLSKISKQLGFDVTSELTQASSISQLQRNLNHKFD